MKPQHKAKMAILKHVSKMMDGAIGNKLKSKHAPVPKHELEQNGLPQEEMNESPKEEQSEEMLLEHMPGEEQHPHDVAPPMHDDSEEDKKLLHHMYSQLK